MAVVLRLWSSKGIGASPQNDEDKALLIEGVLQGRGALGKYIRDCNIDAHDGRGSVVFTADVSRAKRFVDQTAAFEFWRRQSRVKPLRPDGKPNRPLTAYNVTFETVI